jgi:AraC-like DNA-binding protein
VPRFRYQLQLRLARALARLPEHGDLATLALELGFSSHAQLTTHFRATYGVAPTPWLRGLGSALKNREAAGRRR